MGSFNIKNNLKLLNAEANLSLRSFCLFTAKESRFIIDGTRYKQIDSVTMRSHLCPTLANAFLVYHEKYWVKSFLHNYISFYCGRYVDAIFVLFHSPEHLKCF